jgi:Type II secretion system (T2SS), protein E, N-terminal domain
VSSSENDFHHVPRSRDGVPNWAADTDPVGPVTPELALVDPALASGDFNSEVTMSSTQFGDGTTFGAADSAAPADPQPLAPLQPIPPLNQSAPAPQVTAPVPAEPAPSVPVTDMRDVPLGTLVFRAGLLPEERLEEALQEGMKTGRRLGEILLERGWVSENDLGHLLAAQKGLPFVELDPAAIDPTAPPLLHPEKARLHGALPIGFQDGVPVVAVADPSNDLVVENVRRALACEPQLVVAGRDALARAIEQAYGGAVATEPVSAAEPASVVESAPAPQVVEAAAPPVEPVAATPEPVFPAAEPVMPVAEPTLPAVEPVVAAEPVAPRVVEPVVPQVAETVVPQIVEPAAPQVDEPSVPMAVKPVPQTIEPAATQPVQNGQDFWLGETVAEPLPQPVLPSEPAGPAEPVMPIEPVAPVAPVPPEAPPAPSLEGEPVAEAPVTEPEPQGTPSWAVALRLADGERIEVGAFVGEAEAMERARSVVAQLAADGGWPFFAGRFLRPDTIVSVDLVQQDADRWLGSSARAAAWTQQQPTS